MTALLVRFLVHLRGSAPAEDRGLIRECIEQEGRDEVDAAVLAKQVACARYPGREASTWRVEKVEPIE